MTSKFLNYNTNKNYYRKHLDNYWFSLDASPYPKIFSVSLFYFVIFFLGFMNRMFNNALLLSFIFLFVLLNYFYGWFSNLLLESVFLGKHTLQLVSNLKIGMLLFILSEVLFFFGFFWGFFWCSVEPTIFVGGFWIPEGLCGLSPFTIPLVNTIILVFSGLCITWSHLSLHLNLFENVRIGMLFTIILAILFLLNQVIEYYKIPLEFGDSVFGSIFFLSTGFHFLHVFIGMIFISVMLIRTWKAVSLKSFHNVGFVFSIWYWHFVDLVWIFLYCFVYFWGGF